MFRMSTIVKYFVFSVTLLILCDAGFAQSGRRIAKPTPVPTATLEVKNSVKPKEKQPSVTIQSLIVTGDIQNEQSYFREDYFDLAVKRLVNQVENRRLDLNIAKIDRMDFKKAQEKAEKETDSYVLWLNFVMQRNCQPDVIVSYAEYAILRPGTGKKLAIGRIDLAAIDKVRKITHRIPAGFKSTADTQMNDVAKSIVARMIDEDWVFN